MIKTNEAIQSGPASGTPKADAEFLPKMVTISWEQEIPVIDKSYCYITDTGDVMMTVWSGTSSDKARLNLGNVYSSWENAKAVAAARKAAVAKVMA